jgi:hypothetical protein
VAKLIDCLIIYHLRIFHSYGNVDIAGEGLQNLGLCSALRAFEQGAIFIVPHLLWHGTSVFPVSSEGPPHSIYSYDTTRMEMQRTYSNPNPHGAWRNERLKQKITIKCRRMITNTLGMSDRSTWDAYSSIAPDSTSDIFRGPYTPILWFVFPIVLMRLITVCYFCHFIIVTK